jgi:LacI family transcriptional regulator
MSITIKMIARDLKLAVSTVSKALADCHEISEHTKKRVRDYVEQLNYVRNIYASNLKKKRTGNIAVVVPEVADSYFSAAINGIESVAQDKSHHVIIYITHEDQSREASIVREFRSGRVDGVLMSVSSGKNTTTHLLELSNSDVPLVFFDRVCDDIEASKVTTNDFDSGYKATELLIRRGCNSVAFLGMTENLSIIRDRLNGYKKAITDNGMRLKEAEIISCGNDEPGAIESLTTLLTSASRPTGIVGSTEKLATLVYAVCNKLSLKIPGDVRVIGFSNMSIASLLSPPLTTITQPAFEMGKAAATVLFKKLEAKTPDTTVEKIVISSVLHERGSAGE